MGLDEDFGGGAGFEEVDAPGHLVERHPVADELFDVEATGGEEGEGAGVGEGVGEAAGEADFLAVDLIGGDADAGLFGGDAEEEHAAPFAGEVEGLLGGLAAAHAFDDDVRAGALGGGLYDPFEVVLFGVHNGGGAEAFGHGSLVGVDLGNDGDGCALEKGELEEDEPDGAGPHEKDDIPALNARPVDAVEAAGDRFGHGRDVEGHVGGHFVALSGGQEAVCGEAAVLGDADGGEVSAEVHEAATTGATGAAADVGVDGDAVAGAEEGNAGTDVFHNAGELVARDEREAGGESTPVDVAVGAA